MKLKKLLFLSTLVLFSSCSLNLNLNNFNSAQGSNSLSTLTSEITSFELTSNSSTSQNQTSELTSDVLPEYEFKNYEEAFSESVVIDENAYTDDQFKLGVEQGEVTQRDDDILRFFSINDTHGALDTNASVSGMDRIYNLINDLENKNGDYINLLLGDIFQGGWLSNKTYGEAFVDVINQMDFSAFVLGNHEFDWGLEVIRNYKDGNLENGELEIPFLGANIYYADTDTHPSWIDPYTIINCDGFKVGVIGLIGDSQESSISVDKIYNYEFKNSISLTRKYAEYLRIEKECDSVVVAIHDYDETFNSSIASFTGNSVIDAIFCGHTHQLIDEKVTRSDGYQIPVVQSNTKNITAGTVDLTFENNVVTNGEVNHYYLSSYTQSNKITEYMNKYASIIEEGNEIFGYTSNGLTKQNIGTDITKYFCEKYNATIGIVNQAGIRATIGAGDIVLSKIIEVLPFENRTLLVKMKGQYIKNFMTKNYNYMYYYCENGYDSLLNNTEYIVAVIDYVYTNSYNSGYFATSKFADVSLMRDDYIEAVKKYY